MTTNHVENLPGMIGRHLLMLDVYRRARKVAPTDLPVLIIGETGTGKELVARAIHDLSSRAGKRFDAVNCAAIPASLAEAELFGAEPGAFTGAVRREGVLSRAHGTTLFLDELCSMGLEVQAKLLRAIEQQEFTRLGGDAPVRASVRLIAGSSRSPDELLATGALRRDLFHRLAAGARQRASHRRVVPFSRRVPREGSTAAGPVSPPGRVSLDATPAARARQRHPCDWSITFSGPRANVWLLTHAGSS